MKLDADYLKELKKRAKRSRVYRKYQLTGLAIAQLLGDEKHKALYIKLAKERNAESLVRLAREIADNANVKNQGAYFMACLKGEAAAPKSAPKPEKKNKNGK